MRRKTRLTILFILLALLSILYISDYVINYQENVQHFTQEEFSFKNEEALDSHFHKHGIEMGFKSAEEYLKRANEVINGNNLQTRQDDNDIAYFNKETEEFVVLSPEGIIRTFFIPDTGIEYFNRQ